MTGSGNVSIAGFTTMGNLTFSKTGGVTFTDDVNANDLTLNGTGTVNLGSGFTHTFTGNITRTSGTLNCGTSTERFGGDVNYTGFITASSATVEYYANGNQTIAGITYGTLILSGSGVKSRTSGTITVNDYLYLRGTVTVEIAANVVMVSKLL